MSKDIASLIVHICNQDNDKKVSFNEFFEDKVGFFRQFCSNDKEFYLDSGMCDLMMSHLLTQVTPKMQWYNCFKRAYLFGCEDYMQSTIYPISNYISLKKKLYLYISWDNTNQRYFCLADFCRADLSNSLLESNTRCLNLEYSLKLLMHYDKAFERDGPHEMKALRDLFSEELLKTIDRCGLEIIVNDCYDFNTSAYFVIESL